jgi:hypothetical protein
MPNHITQHIHFRTSEKMQEIRERLKGVLKGVDINDDGSVSAFSFDRILPMPATVRRDPNPMFLSDEEHQWRCDHWGTKWTAYAIKELPDGWKYETAWARPDPILQTVSAIFSEVPFAVEAVDEGGWYLGVSEWLGGGIVEDRKLEWDSVEGKVMRTHLRPWDDGTDDED